MYDIRDKSNAIREAQRFLLEIHYAESYIPHIAIDGIYGKETAEAIRIFQAYNNLPLTGEIDYITWNLLYEQYREAYLKRTNYDFLISEKNLPLSVGAVGEDVELLQFIVNRLSPKYSAFGKVATNGVYGYELANAVSEIQKIYRMERTGILDRNTLNYMLFDLSQTEKTE
jgi:peptidoglycan hydrolase-like protein with peptidoglycan-binding domain